MENEHENFDPSLRITSCSNDGPYPFTNEPCCPVWRELCITREINIKLPKYNGKNVYVWYINTNCADGMLRWHRIAFCPFCGTPKNK